MCLVYTSAIEKLITYETEEAIKLKEVYVNDKELMLIF
jgi:GH18 family chitinase